MSDGSTEVAEIHLLVTDNLAEADKRLAALNDRMGHTSADGNTLAKIFGDMRDTLGSQGAAMEVTTVKAGAMTAQFKLLTDELAKYKIAAIEAARENVIGGATGAGVTPDLTTAATSAELERRIAIQNAASFNAIAADKAELASREKFIAQDLALTEKQSAARTAAYSKELAEALSVDDQLAAADEARAAKRYATVPNAARNVANPADMALAQSGAGYASAATETADYSAKTRERAEATNLATAATEKDTASLPRLRYALYDVSGALGVAGLALSAAAIAPVAVASSYDKLFASVQRTTTGLTGSPAQLATQFDVLKKSLVDLTTQIPLSFDSITQIATLGNQLNIPESSLVSFTKTVAEFSASTNVSVDAAATAFGRLGQLLGTTDYKMLADQITYLGVRSVSTESQIIGIAQQIAVSTQAANYGTKATLTLSAAMASLGIAPEAARGSIGRLFSTITDAVTNGGTKLNDFAAISHETVAQFSSDWKNDPQVALKAFLSGLQTATGGAADTLKGLGISSQRDLKTVGLLSQNIGVLTSLTADSANASGYLDKSYGVVLDTVSAKATIFGNNIKRVFDDIGQNTQGPIKSALDILNWLSSAIDSLLSSPWAAWGLTVDGVIVAIMAVASLAAAAFFRLSATILALRTAQGETTGTTSVFSAALAAWSTSATTATAATERLTVANQGLSASNAEVSATTTTLAATSAEATGAQAGLSASAGTAEKATGKLSGVLGKAGLVGSILLSVAALPVLANLFVDTAQKAMGLTADVDTLMKKIELLGNAGDSGNMKSLAKLLGDSGAPIGGINANINQTSWHSMDTGGLNAPRAALNKQQTGSGTGDPTNDGGQAVNDAADKFAKAAKTYDDALAALQSSGNTKGAAAGLDYFQSEVDKAGLNTQEAAQFLPSYTAALGANSGASLDAAASAKIAGDAAASAAADFKVTMTDTYALANAQAQLATDSGALGTAFAKDGASAASNGSAMQKIMSQIYSSSTGAPQAAARMQGLFDALVKGGFASAAQLANLHAVILQLTQGKGTAAMAFDMTAFGDANAAAATKIDKAAQSAQAAAPKIVTLVDYANELVSVFKRIDDIKFAPETGLDKIALVWNGIAATTVQANKDIQKSITDTATKVAQYQATMTQLSSDKTINEYWLSVAQKYGDALRAGQLQASLVGTNQKLADAQTGLATAQSDGATTVAAAQDKMNKTLDGNSDAAIANRAQLLGLVGDYQDYIAKLAASGASQETLKTESARLKAEFVAQATQAGFSGDAILKYAATFDDMTKAINAVPRDITVTANTDPALQAINEFMDKAAAAAAKGVSVPVSTTAETNSKGDRENALKARIAALSEYITELAAAHNGPGASHVSDEIGAIAQQLQSGNYASGGYTGDGGKYDIAGIVHAGEFVFSKEATSNIGVSNLAYAHDMAKTGARPSPSSGGSFGGHGSSGPVDLTAGTIAAVASALSLQFNVPGSFLAKAVSTHNSNSSSIGA